MGVEITYNHADYRLMSKRAIDALAEFKEAYQFTLDYPEELGMTITSSVKLDADELLKMFDKLFNSKNNAEYKVVIDHSL